MTENTVLPLINTAFEPGNARKAAENFADRGFPGGNGVAFRPAILK